jgi:hypothetical protein
VRRYEFVLSYFTESLFRILWLHILKIPIDLFQEKALEQLKVTEGKTVAVGQKMDLVFHTLQIGFFYMDFDLISKSIDKAKK